MVNIKETHRLKELEGFGIEINYRGKYGDKNNISGKLTFVSKESIIVIGQMEHIIKRDKIVDFKPIKYCKGLKSEIKK